MKKLLRFVVIPILATALTAMLTVTGASAGSDTRPFRWIAGDATFFGPDCLTATFPTPSCPNAAIASSAGQRIDIAGQGVLTVHPKTITMDEEGTFFADAGLVMGGRSCGGHMGRGGALELQVLWPRGPEPPVQPPPELSRGACHDPYPPPGR